jgi:hypothetical protein
MEGTRFSGRGVSRSCLIGPAGGLRTPKARGGFFPARKGSTEQAIAAPGQLDQAERRCGEEKRVDQIGWIGGERRGCGTDACRGEMRKE